jgi:hypothetical protein
VPLPLAIPILALGALLSTLVLWGMLQGSQSWLTTLLTRLAHPQGNFITKAALYPFTKAVEGVLSIIHSVEHTISVAAVHGMSAVAHWFDGLARWTLYNATVAGNFAEETARAFERLTAHTIPRIVAKAIAVPLHEIRIGLRHLERELEQLRRYARGIDRLVHHTIWPAILRLAHAVDITLPRTIGRVRARVGAAERAISHPSSRWVKAIWKRGWILVGASLMVRFLVRKFPYLFCRNVTKVAKTVCGWPNLLADLLLGEALAAFVITDLCDVVVAIEKVAEGFDPVLRAMVTGGEDFLPHCGGNLPSAHDPPGYSGDWNPTATVG